jgi:hypothetical protein
MDGETTQPDARAVPRCLDCPNRATHGLMRSKRGIYDGAPVRHGPRWCKTHGIAAAMRRNTAESLPPGQEEA